MILKSLRRDETGAVVVEFALVVPFFMLMVFGIIDFSRAYYALNNLNSGLREGARYASTLPNDATLKPGTTAGNAEIKARILSFSQAYGSAIDVSRVNIDATTIDTDGMIKVGVVNYPFTLITPLARTVGYGTINITRTVKFRWESSPKPGT